MAKGNTLSLTEKLKALLASPDDVLEALVEIDSSVLEAQADWSKSDAGAVEDCADPLEGLKRSAKTEVFSADIATLVAPAVGAPVAFPPTIMPDTAQLDAGAIFDYEFVVRCDTNGGTLTDFLAYLYWGAVEIGKGQLAGAPASGDHIVLKGTFRILNNPGGPNRLVSVTTDETIVDGGVGGTSVRTVTSVLDTLVAGAPISCLVQVAGVSDPTDSFSLVYRSYCRRINTVGV